MCVATPPQPGYVTTWSNHSGCAHAIPGAEQYRCSVSGVAVLRGGQLRPEGSVM